MLSDSQIAGWRLLAQTASTGSLAQAARTLGMTKAKASRLLAGLEAASGVTLLDRSRKPAALTPEALRLLPAARSLIDAADRLAAAPSGDGLPSSSSSSRAESSDHGAGRRATRVMRISLASNMATAVLLKLFEGFEAENGVTIEVLRECGVRGLLAGRADFAWFGFRPEPTSGLRIFPMGESYSFLMASRAYLRRCGVPTRIEDLREHVILMRDTANGSFEDTLECDGRTWRIDDTYATRRECADICRERLIAGEGIAMDLTPGFVMRELADNTVVPVLPGWRRRPWPIVLAALPERAADPMVRKLIDTIVRQTVAGGSINDWRFWFRRFGFPMPG